MQLGALCGDGAHRGRSASSLLSVSYDRNRTYIAETQAELAKIERGAARRADGAAGSAAAASRRDARRWSIAADRYRERPPVAMRWGLYQGTSLGNAARDAYVRELDGVLLPRIAARFEKRLGEYRAGAGKAVRVSQGVPDARRAQAPGQEAPAVRRRSRVARRRHRGRRNAGTSLSQHFQSLLEYGDSLRPMALNAIAHRAGAQHAATGLDPADHLQPPAAHLRQRQRARGEARSGGRRRRRQVLRRKNGKSLSEPVPSFYSRPVFQEIAGKQIGDLVKQFAADDWVWGEGGRDSAAARTASAWKSPDSTNGTTSPPGKACSTTSSSCRSRTPRRPSNRSAFSRRPGHHSAACCPRSSTTPRSSRSPRPRIKRWRRPRKRPPRRV